MSRSPRLTAPATAHDATTQPATDAEIVALVDLGHSLGANTVAIGHGRDIVACTNAARFARRWESNGGTVGTDAGFGDI